MNEMIYNIFNEHVELANKCSVELNDKLFLVCDKIYTALENGNKIILFGNGGSAADAQHIAAEFTGRFVRERKALSAIALTTDTSALTAIGNDYGFEFIFSRQLEALANTGDILIGLSTSGNSSNVLNAFKKGRSLGTINIGLTGREGGEMNLLSDINIIVPSTTTARIQEMHILIGHIICEYIDDKIK